MATNSMFQPFVYVAFVPRSIGVSTLKNNAIDPTNTSMTALSLASKIAYNIYTLIFLDSNRDGIELE